MKKILVTILALVSVVCIAFGFGCNKKQEKRFNAPEEIQEYINFSNVVLPLVQKPVVLSFTTNDNGLINRTELQLSVGVIDYNDTQAFSVQGLILNNGNLVASLRILGDGIYFDVPSSDIYLYVAYDFKTLFDNMGMGVAPEEEESEDNAKLEDLFFGGSAGGGAGSGSNAIDSIFEQLSANAEAIETGKECTVSVDLSTMIKGLLVEIRTFTQRVPSIDKYVSTIQTLLKDVVIVADFYFNDNVFQGFCSQFTVFGIDVELKLEYMPEDGSLGDTTINGSLDKDKYFNIVNFATNIITKEDLAELLTLLQNALEWFNYGNVSFEIETMVTLGAKTPKDYMVKGKVSLSGQPIKINDIIEPLINYLSTMENEQVSELINGILGSGNIDIGFNEIVSILQSFTEQQLTEIWNIISGSFKTFKFNVQVVFDRLAIYGTTNNNGEIIVDDTPIREIRQLQFFVDKTGIKVVKEAGVIEPHVYINKTGEMLEYFSLEDLFYEFMLSNSYQVLMPSRFDVIKLGIECLDGKIVSAINIQVGDREYVKVYDFTYSAISEE